MLIKTVFENKENVVSLILRREEPVIVFDLYVDDELEAFGVSALGDPVNITDGDSPLYFEAILHCKQQDW